MKKTIYLTSRKASVAQFELHKKIISLIYRPVWNMKRFAKPLKHHLYIAFLCHDHLMDVHLQLPTDGHRSDYDAQKARSEKHHGRCEVVQCYVTTERQICRVVVK